MKYTDIGKYEKAVLAWNANGQKGPKPEYVRGASGSALAKGAKKAKVDISSLADKPNLLEAMTKLTNSRKTMMGPAEIKAEMQRIRDAGGPANEEEKTFMEKQGIKYVPAGSQKKRKTTKFSGHPKGGMNPEFDPERTRSVRKAFNQK